MTRLTNFWFALENLFGGLGVRRDWEQETKAELAVAFRWLCPNGDTAHSYPHPRGGERLEIVEHAPDDLVAVGEDGTRLVVQPADVVVHAINHPKLQGALAALFEADYDGQRCDAAPRLWRIGHYTPIAGETFPVFFHIPYEPRDLLQALHVCLTMTNRPFFLLAPTNRSLRGAAQQLTEQRPIVFLPLADVVEFQPPHAFVWSELGDRELQRFKTRFLPPVAGTPMRFPTPAVATWADVEMWFVDDHTVTIKIGDVLGTYNYTQMNMADGRNAKPTKQWLLLREMATHYGTYTFQKPKPAGRGEQFPKRRELLAKDLSAFFQLDGEPILPNGKNAWRTAFQLRPDALRL